MSGIQLSPSNNIFIFIIFILGLCLLIFFLPYPVWPQAFPIELFQATLTIEIDPADNFCEEGEISKSILLFGFDQPERIISLPKPSESCLMASFDPNNTSADGRTFAHEHHGGSDEWMVAFLPSQPLRGTWGIRISYPEPHTTSSLQLTWKAKGSDGLPPGQFFLKRDQWNFRGIDMENTSSISMKDVANDEILKIEYYHDNCLFDTNIPSGEDDYEPDDHLTQATMYEDQDQIHTLHDPNDTDWIRFEVRSEKKYYIYLKLICPPPIDPNIVPFDADLVIDGNYLTLPALELWSLNPPEYVTIWENETKEGFFAYLKIKINPDLEHLGFLPYLFSLEERKLGYMDIPMTWRISAKNKGFIEQFYLKSNKSHEECHKPPLPDKHDPSDPNFLLYKYNCYEFETDSDSFSLWLFDTMLENNFNVKQGTVNLDDYIPSIPPDPSDTNQTIPYDPDCDGITGEDDPNPNRPNLLFRSGMNLYHHPFHPYFKRKIAEKIDLCRLFKPYLLPESHLRASQVSFFIKHLERPGVGWHYYLIDSNCTPDNFPLSNKAGCLLYLPNDPNDRYLVGNWGECFSEMLDNNQDFEPNDPNNLMIELTQGLNIIGLAYYEAFTFEKNKGSEYRTFGDKCVDSFALLRSINSPATSLERSALLVGPNISMDIPKAQVYPEQNIHSSVLRYDSRKGKWSYCTTFFGHPSGDRFDIGIDEAYLVYFPDPNNNQKDPNNNLQDLIRGKNWYPAIFFWP